MKKKCPKKCLILERHTVKNIISNLYYFILLKFLYIIADWVVNLGRFGWFFPFYDLFLNFLIFLIFVTFVFYIIYLIFFILFWIKQKKVLNQKRYLIYDTRNYFSNIFFDLKDTIKDKLSYFRRRNIILTFLCFDFFDYL